MPRKKNGRKNRQSPNDSTNNRKNVENKKEIEVTNNVIDRKDSKISKELPDNISNEIVNMDSEIKSDTIKSVAIVKYSVPRPPDFIKLQSNTDLNLPPANWLSSSADSYGLQRAFSLSHKGFTR